MPTVEGTNEARTAGSRWIILLERFGVAEHNPDPLQRTIHAMPRRGGIFKWVRLIRYGWEIRAKIPGLLLAKFDKQVRIVKAVYDARPWRPLSPEEQMVRDEQIRRKKLKSVIASDADLYMDRIINALDRRGYFHRPTKDESRGGMRITRHVGFDLVKLQPEAIYLRINTARLPYGVAIMDLMDRPLLVDLSIACGHRVSAEYSERVGAWYIIERAVGVRGIPEHVRYLDMFNAIPASADGLTIPIGMALNAKPIYRSLARMYSMLVAGTIGGGKSNILNVALVTLIRRNSPDRLKFILVDLKGGLEFQYFEGIPHLIPLPGIAPGGIADKSEQVPGILHWLHEEGEKRMKIIREAGHKNIGRYNAYRKSGRMPHIVLVIDEWADVMYNKAIARDCEETLANVAQRFRAVGIHVILCTQIPKAEVISTRIKGVLPAKLAFSVPTLAASMVIVDNGDARGLQPVGRCVYQWDGQYEVQTPYINEEIISEIVNGAISGVYEESKSTHDVTILELMEYALANESGYLSRDLLYREYKARGLTMDELNQWLSSMEGQEYVIGTSLYRVDSARGNRPRRLVAVDEDADDIPDDPTPPEPPAPKHDVELMEVLEYAMINLGGDLSQAKLFEVFRQRGLTLAELSSWLAGIEYQEIRIGSEYYQVKPSSGRSPRRLVKAAKNLGGRQL